MSEEMAALHGDLREVRRALFGDMLRQEPGLVKTVQHMERTVDEIGRQQTELMRLLPLVEQLRQDNEERRREEGEARSNRVSRGLADLARILTVVLLAMPAVAWDMRMLWLGSNPLAALGVLGGAVGAVSLLSIVTRKS